MKIHLIGDNMIDKDGIERPDSTDEHMREIVNDNRNLSFNESYSFRPRSIFFRVWASIFRFLAICVFNPFMRLYRHLKIFGKENRAKLRHKGFVITCNHVYLLDDLSVGTNVFSTRKIYFTTLAQNIKRPMVGFWLRSLGGIPIPSESLSGMKKFYDDISYLLKKNKPVLFNPEASMWPFYREIRPFKRGAFQTAVRNDVPVLPIVALFKRKKKRNGKFSYSLSFALCNPIYVDKNLESERERIEDMTKRAFEVSKNVADEWYNIQDCGFDDEVGKPKIKAKNLIFKNDKWIVKKTK